jgi:anhydro-N-acetylmuramic acid kinase
MTGTSLDGIDAVLVHFNETGAPRSLAHRSAPFSPQLRSWLFALQTPSVGEVDLAHRAALAHADEVAAVVLEILAQAAQETPAPCAVAVHGQTIRHQPKEGYSVQLLAGARLAERIGLDVIGDFRAADLAAGGQGAPLVPAFHHAVFATQERRAIVNLGGIANISVVQLHQPTYGYDTGPGNVLLDAWIAMHCGQDFDAGGGWAAQGEVIPGLLRAMQQHPFFAQDPPKSTGRGDFHLGWLETMLHSLARVRPVDVQRTLLELSAWSIAKACNQSGSKSVWLCGGGAFNLRLAQSISERSQLAVRSVADLGIHPQQVEACAFAWLGYRFLQRETGNLPAVTGATKPKVLGALWPAS